MDKLVILLVCISLLGCRAKEQVGTDLSSVEDFTTISGPIATGTIYQLQWHDRSITIITTKTEQFYVADCSGTVWKVVAGGFHPIGGAYDSVTLTGPVRVHHLPRTGAIPNG